MLVNIIISAVLSNYKISRRLIMLVGVCFSLFFAVILTAMAFLVVLESSRKIFFYYWTFNCIGYGVIVEVYVEEIMPTKGI